MIPIAIVLLIAGAVLLAIRVHATLAMMHEMDALERLLAEHERANNNGHYASAEAITQQKGA